jgi:hypothetical protein
MILVLLLFLLEAGGHLGMGSLALYGLDQLRLGELLL